MVHGWSLLVPELHNLANVLVNHMTGVVVRPEGLPVVRIFGSRKCLLCTIVHNWNTLKMDVVKGQMSAADQGMTTNYCLLCTNTGVSTILGIHIAVIVFEKERSRTMPN